MSNHSIGRRHGLWLAAGLAFCGAVAVLGLAPAGLAGYGTPVDAQFRDQSGDRIQSDGKGAYIDGVQGVEAVFDGRGDFDLDTSVGGQAPIRFLSMDFSQVATSAQNGCTAPFPGPKLVDGYMTTGVGGLPGMMVGTSEASTLAVHFAGWFVEFDPGSGGQRVTVMRTAANTWTIVAASTTIAALQRVTMSKGKIVLVPCGTYFMPFEVTVTLQ